MRKLTFTLIGLLALSLFAAEEQIDLKNLKFGKNKPEIYFDGLYHALKFKVIPNDATAAELPKIYDFSKGCKITLEFCDNGDQNNPYPRLVEGRRFSIHFEGKGEQIHLKLVFYNNDMKRYNTLITPCPEKIGFWQSMTFAYDAETNTILLQANTDSPETNTVTFVTDQSKNKLILGASKFAGSNRGYNGSIKNMKITAPYKIAAKDKLPKVPVTPGVKHQKICAIAHRHLAFPGVAKLPNGDLAVVFREAEDHICPYGRICIIYSKDGGKNWSAPVSISDTESDERDPAIQVMPDGRVMVCHGGWNSWMSIKALAEQFSSETNYIKQAGANNFGGSFFLFSDDNGKTFSRPVKAPAFTPHGPAIAEDGTLYQPTLGNDNGKRQVYMYKGSPDATQWEKIGLVAEMPLSEKAKYEEPHTVILRDGTMVTAIRVPMPGDGYMRISFSKDMGKTWSEPIKTPVRGYPQHLLELKDGRLLATYGYRYTPMGVRGCISNDGGKTWDIKNEIIIQNNGGNVDLGYPVSIELENGEVLCVYYHNSAAHDSCYIEGATFKP
ncbi:MAG: exo-alpha-sialidase [Lentisphaeria bacterium]|nr:exo-alpha-sialidase [Lentisphaeria bacterium]